MTDEDDGITEAEVKGKVEIVVTLSPAGIGRLTPDGWDIKRWVRYRWYSNGELSGFGNEDDTSNPDWKDLWPVIDDTIYDLLSTD